jgi:hypothetical protein
MNYFIIEPEVAGGFGENSTLDPTYRPPRVIRFHYEFDGWLGDELLETVACFIATRSVADALQSLEMTGVEFDQVETSKSQMFEELHPRRRLPEFVWLKVTGIAGKDDFGLSKAHRLVVSEKVLRVLKTRMRHCAISPYIDA